MKRILFLVALLAAVVSSASAQKGQSAVGINLGAAPCLESGVSLTNFELGAKYQYGVTDAIRLEGAFSYGFKSKDIDVLELSANVHYLFNLGDRFKVYPLIGIGYGRISAHFSDDDFDLDMDDFDYYSSRAYGNPYDYEDEEYDGDDSSSLNRFLFNVGAGAEYALSSKLSVGVEVKYQYMKDFSRLPISVGVTYKF